MTHVYVFILFPVLAVIPIMLIANIYRAYLRVPILKSYVLSIVAILSFAIEGGFLAGFGPEDPRFWQPNGNHAAMRFRELNHNNVAYFIAAILLPLFALPFVTKLYLAWIAGQATEAEKSPGMAGVRAWLHFGNIACALLISLSLWLGFECSFWEVLVLCIMAILAFPIMNLITTTSQAPALNVDSFSPDRERVLKMLDDGKINAQESAELLSALGHSTPPRAPQPIQSPHRTMVWIGLALLVAGFFFPWFVVKNETAESLNQFMQSQQNLPNIPKLFPVSTTVYIAGGDITHGLGWWILLFGIVAAILPYIGANIDSQTCQKICVFALAFGAVILIYVFAQSYRFAGVGILLCFIGYVLEFIGILKERPLEWRRAF